VALRKEDRSANIKENKAMELRTVDPRVLKPNPANPRQTAPNADAEQQLAINIKAIGIIQPPLVREKDGELIIVAGDRRTRAAIAAGLTEILVLVRGPDDGSDLLRSIAENIIRAEMGPVDQWRAIEALSSAHWTDDAIAGALAFPVRQIKKLRFLAHIHPTMLDHIAKGDMPKLDLLRTIAAANAEEQSSVWKKYRPKKGQSTVAWWEVARALEKRRIYARIAQFGPDEEQAFGVVWEEDLFVPGDEDTRYTTNVEGFFAAQAAWMEANLPKNGVVLPTDDYGSPKLPPKAERVHGQAKKSDTIGQWVDPRTGAIQEVVLRMPKADPKKGKSGFSEASEEAPLPPPKTRSEITQKGMELIGDLRTGALTKALLENPIDDIDLLGMLILAFSAGNVDIKTSGYEGLDRRRIAQRVTEGGHITKDLDILRQAARETLSLILTCRVGYNSSGIVSRFAGDAIGADAHLPNMATEEFLSCLSKAAIERAAASIGVLPRPRAKETRAALIEQVGKGTFVLPAACFAPKEEELAAHQSATRGPFGCDEDQDDDLAGDNSVKPPADATIPGEDVDDGADEFEAENVEEAASPA
jgi:ParB/RepB/Spo0J family partition protein